MSIRSIAGARLPSSAKYRSQESKCEDFDDILEAVGSESKYQRWFLYFVLSPIIAVQPFFTLNAIFMLNEPDHWCHVPGRNNLTSLETWKNATLPTENGADGLLRHSTCLMLNVTTGQSMDCKYGYEYDKKDYELTIPSQFDWVCSKSHYGTDALTLYAVGNAFGTIMFGQAADKFGRKPVFFITLFINLFFRLVSLFVVDNFILFLALQFIIGTAFPLMYIAPCLIAAESSGKDYRAWIYSFTWMIWVVGMASLPFLAWLTRSWFWMGIVTTVPGVLLVVYYWWIPESPRWLVSQGKIEEAKAVIKTIAKANGRSNKLSESQLDGMLKVLVIKQDQSDKRTGVWTLFARPRLAKNTIMVTISWGMNSLIYYGVTLNSSNLSGNQFVNFFILAIIEVPAGYLGGVFADKIGRRWTQVIFFFACGLSSFGAGIGAIFPHMSLAVVILNIITKFCVTLTFLIIYMQAAEVFPTQLRSTGSGFASTIASVMSIGGPYMIFLGKVNVSLPYMFIGVLSCIGTLASMFLPETLNHKLPETIDEAQDFGKDQKFWSFCPTEKKPQKT